MQFNLSGKKHRVDVAALSQTVDLWMMYTKAQVHVFRINFFFCVRRAPKKMALNLEAPPSKEQLKEIDLMDVNVW